VANGTVVPRNDFVGRPIKRLDTRLQRHFKAGHVGADGILEVFNLFNRANYGGYVTNESSLQYKQPSSSTNLSLRATKSAAWVPPDVLSHEPRRREGTKTTIFISCSSYLRVHIGVSIAHDEARECARDRTDLRAPLPRRRLRESGADTEP